MKNNRRFCNTLGLCFIIALFLFSSIFIFRNAEAADHAQTVKKFMIALQQNDFKTIFMLYEPYQQSIYSIKQNNPKVFWEQKINEHYSRSQEQFKNDEDNDLSSLKRFVPPAAKINVIEHCCPTIFI